MTIAALSLVPAWVLANVPGERRARARDAGSDAGGDAADEAADEAALYAVQERRGTAREAGSCAALEP
jgi:hypothetical protein